MVSAKKNKGTAGQARNLGGPLDLGDAPLSVLIAVPRPYPAILNGTGLLIHKDEQVLPDSKTFRLLPCALLRARTRLAHRLRLPNYGYPP